MCCCGKPNINGQPGYSWDGRSFGTRPVNPPALAERDELICDEPGRCGGIDSHSHHFRLVKGQYGLALLVRHGGGDERIGLGVIARLLLPTIEGLDSNARYWLLHSLYSAHREAKEHATQVCNATWRTAAAEKRIKTRKVSRGSWAHGVKVWIEPPKTEAHV